MHTTELESLIDSELDGRALQSKRGLVNLLQKDSFFLKLQNAELANVWRQLSGKITSFFETEDSPTLWRDENDASWRRKGHAELTVQRSSAQLFSPNEVRLPIYKNHTEMVKFDSAVDDNFVSVVNIMTKYISGASPEWGELVDCMLLDIRASKIPNDLRLQSPTQNTSYYWIVKHIDFQQWISSASPTNLWLFAPEKCELIKSCGELPGILGAPIKHDEYSTFRIIITGSSDDKDPGSKTLLFVCALMYQLLSSISDEEKSRCILKTFLNVVSEEYKGPMPIQIARDLQASMGKVTLENFLNKLHGSVTARPFPTNSLWKALKTTLLSSAHLLDHPLLVVAAFTFTGETDCFFKEYQLLLKEARCALHLKVLSILETTHDLGKSTIYDLRGETHIEYDTERQGINNLLK
ncbi:Similar to hypothetical protein SMAC_12619 [Sordaria macrospora k-hell]; acc. no. XP_003347397 [Pyronema omphalodes CBS 100304]|uniref:Uncharacterized protein n=1 Tax=Pyronema omphalodes (strain CBS 100304) TaxID=1076935 RepID=U4LQE0_PYROM|nr:Similar to hypothetical protein SMAC_12619 [Sordaria macrospora k-hell]; acc. no. XP_003347397 [Pyronema omphalodes CBS 100304]